MNEKALRYISLGNARRLKRGQAKLQERCDLWNDAHPVGTFVEYHPVIGAANHRLRTTKGKAEVLSGHTAVVWLEGESGCVALDACVVLSNPQPV